MFSLPTATALWGGGLGLIININFSLTHTAILISKCKSSSLKSTVRVVKLARLRYGTYSIIFSIEQSVVVY